MNQINIVRLADIKIIDHLVVDSLSQGFRFIDRLAREYRCDRNRFDKCGEILLVALVEEKAIADGVATSIGHHFNDLFNDEDTEEVRAIESEGSESNFLNRWW